MEEPKAGTSGRLPFQPFQPLLPVQPFQRLQPCYPPNGTTKNRISAISST